jgi:hypothetical protein
MSKERALMCHQPSNTNTIFVFCAGCDWGIGLAPAAGGLATQKEIDEAFNAHLLHKQKKIRHLPGKKDGDGSF